MKIKEHEPIAPRTTLKVGGTARYFCEATSISELRDALSFADSHSVRVFILGGGSNIVFTDGEYSGLVVKLSILGTEVLDEDSESIVLKVAAGESWDGFVKDVTEKGYWGVENLSGIPGLIGAAPIQNINAYGSAVADVIEAVEAIHIDSKKERTFTAAECTFGYRDSFFKSEAGQKWTIIAVVFRLSKHPVSNTSYRSATNSIELKLKERGVANPTPKDVREVVLKTRADIGMIEGIYQSAGSFFKNVIVPKEQFKAIEQAINSTHRELSKKLTPWFWELEDGQVKISAAFLMECTPYNKTAFDNQTFRDHVSISPLHTLSIINKGGATAADIKAFTEEIQRAVQKIAGVKIELEVIFVS